MTPLELPSHKETMEAHQDLKVKHRYNATYYLRMVADHGAIGAAKLLLKSPDPQDGLITLWELGLLEMSVENGVLDPRYHSLFTDEERAVARARLKKLNFVSPFDRALSHLRRTVHPTPQATRRNRRLAKPAGAGFVMERRNLMRRSLRRPGLLPAPGRPFPHCWGPGGDLMQRLDRSFPPQRVALVPPAPPPRGGDGGAKSV